MKITITSNHRKKDNAYQLIKFLRGTLGFSTVYGDINNVVMSCDSVSDYDSGFINDLIDELKLKCNVRFEA
jgi:hypothetical protein